MLWIYIAIVMLVGRYLGLHLFGEGISMHLNGSLVGATRIQPRQEVFTWAAFNGILLALIPYVVFRRRGYSRAALNFAIGQPQKRLPRDLRSVTDELPA